ncbi:MAG: trypsin-like peptidase domain-containing protein [Planctomycetota bacterium]
MKSLFLSLHQFVIGFLVWSTSVGAVTRCGGQDLAVDAPSPPDVSYVDASDGARALSRAFRNAARSATPSVVTVFSYGQNEDSNESPAESEPESTEPPIGPTPPPRSEEDGLTLSGLGSGVLVDSTGWIVTNHHVITGAKRVRVQLPDETEWVATRVHGDPTSDIAVLKIECGEPLPFLSYGNSDSLEIGDWVLAIGSPFKLEATVSAGIISAKNRSLGQIRRGRLLQTDAAINPGNSGGPLIDLDGRLIAISTAIATRNGGYQGIGFAIPSNQANWIARELREFGRVRRAAMGIRLAELNPSVARKLSLKPYLGVLVYQVIRDSAADRAGLESLDIILEFAGQRVRRTRELQEVVEREPIGSTQEVRIQRNGKELTLPIVLAPLEDPTALAGDADDVDGETVDSASSNEASTSEATTDEAQEATPVPNSPPNGDTAVEDDAVE